jgi:hypothetical protein
VGETVVRMRRGTLREKTDDHWIWRQAVMLVGQLPEDEEAATRILEKASDLYAQHRAEIKPA